MVVTEVNSALGHINVTLVSSRCWFTLGLESFMKMRIWLVPLNWHARLLYLRYLCTVIWNWEFHLEIYLGKNKICFIIKYSTCQMWDVSHFDALKRLNFHMRILNMDHSETELLLVTRMASTFFSFTFLFQTIHSIIVLSSCLLKVRPRFAQG